METVAGNLKYGFPVFQFFESEDVWEMKAVITSIYSMCGIL
jgi:hypothetical protein